MVFPFEAVFEDQTKLGTKIQTSEYREAGVHIIIDQGQEQIAGYTDREEGIFTAVPAIVFGDHSRIIKYVDKPFFLGADGVKVLRCRKPYPNYRYLYYALRHAKIPDTGYNRHYKWLKEIEIEYPDTSQQAEIATILDKVSGVISDRQRQLQTLDTLIKARFVEMFDADAPIVKLGSICKMINGDRGKNYPSGNDFVSEGIPFVNAGHLQNRIVDFAGMNYITEAKYNLLSQGKIQTGDILYCLRGSLGKHALVTFDQGAIASSLVILRCDTKRVLPRFLLYAIETPEIEKQLKAANNGSSQPNLSAASVKAYEIKLPPIVDQQAFVNFVSQVDKSKVAIQTALDKAQLLFDSLMQKYFG